MEKVKDLMVYKGRISEIKVICRDKKKSSAALTQRKILVAAPPTLYTMMTTIVIRPTLSINGSVYNINLFYLKLLKKLYQRYFHSGCC